MPKPVTGTPYLLNAKVTIYDVAREAGVAIKTVSRVMNGETGVSDKTRLRVANVAANLGYVPNKDASRLAGGKSKLIALLFDEAKPGALMEVQNSIIEVLRPRGYHLISEGVDLRSGRGHETVGTMAQASRPDALIVLPHLSDRVETMDYVAALGIPFATIGQTRVDRALSCAIYDNGEAMKAMIRNILTLGHQRIGFIAGDPRNPDSRQLYEGFWGGVREAGLEAGQVLVEQGDGSFISGVQAANSLLARQNRPTVVIASTDEMAVGAISVANRKGKTVPSSLSVCGFGDTNLSRILWPQLTTVRHPFAAMARDLVEGILKGSARDRNWAGEVLMRGTVETVAS